MAKCSCHFLSQCFGLSIFHTHTHIPAPEVHIALGFLRSCEKISSLRWPLEPSEFVFEETDSVLFVYLQMKPGRCKEDVRGVVINVSFFSPKGWEGQTVTHTDAGNVPFSSDHMSQLHGLTHVAREIERKFSSRPKFFLLFGWSIIALRVVLVSAVQQSESSICIHIPSSYASFPPRDISLQCQLPKLAFTWQFLTVYLLSYFIFVIRLSVYKLK